MAKTDQDMRERNLKEADSWDSSVDAKHTKRMKEIVAEIGWLTASRVGEQSAHNAWLLVQHANRHVDFQEQCLALMKGESDGEVALRDIAMLEDRVRVNSDQPQLYGTQFQQIDGKFVPRPIEDEENVNRRRQQMGLETLEENIVGMHKKYQTPR